MDYSTHNPYSFIWREQFMNIQGKPQFNHESYQDGKSIVRVFTRNSQNHVDTLPIGQLTKIGHFCNRATNKNEPFSFKNKWPGFSRVVQNLPYPWINHFLSVIFNKNRLFRVRVRKILKGFSREIQDIDINLPFLKSYSIWSP